MEQVSEPCEKMYRDLLRDMKMNLREALHMVELRTMPQGHPDYRFIAQEIWRKI
jgi:hypothetical protein